MLTKWWKHRVLVLFYVDNAFSCNNNYMDYTNNNGDEGRGNYELCYDLVLNMKCKNKLKIELSPTDVTFYDLDSYCHTVLILDKAMYLKFYHCDCELPEASHMLFALFFVPVPSC